MKSRSALGLLYVIIFLFLPGESWSQGFLNGDFENNSALTDQLNIPNPQYNLYMQDSKAFGTYGNMDIIHSNTFCSSGAQHGNWYLGITAGDMISIKLSDTLVPGLHYNLSYYDRFPDYGIEAHPLQMGLSQSDTSFGTVIHTATLADTCEWSIRTFGFIAPNNGQYITIRFASGKYYSSWWHIDNFVLQADVSVQPYEQTWVTNPYPNPFTNFIAITGIETNTEIKLYNAVGELIGNYISTNTNCMIPTENLRSGIYFLRIGTVTKKIIKQ